MTTSHVLTPHLTIATHDGAGSRAALRWAANLLQTHPADATLVTVEQEPAASTALHLESAEMVLRTMAEGSTVEGEARTGDPVDELIESAAASGSELIVIGGQAGIGLGIHGSVHGRLAAVSPVPVAVIPAGWRPGPGPIAVGISNDSASDGALDYAVKLARRTQTRISLTHVWESPTVGAIDPADGTGESIPDRQRSALEARAREVRTANPDLDVSADLRTGDPIVRLMDAGEESSLLVLGRRPHSAIGRVLGSMSARVLGELPCPVIVVPLQREGLRVAPDVPGEEL